MILAVATSLTPVVVVTGSAWLMPSIQRPDLPFGVRVPADRVGDDAIVEANRTFRHRMLVSGMLVLLASVVLSSVFDGGSPAAAVPVGIAPILPLVLAVVVFYLRARASILRAKAEQRWYDNVRQRVTVDTSLRTTPEHFPWVWTLLSVAVVLATLVAGIAMYPSMPARVPWHSNGTTVDAWRDKSPWVVGMPVVLEALLTVLIIGLLVWSFRSRADLEPSAPQRSAQQHRMFLRRIGRALLVLIACANASILLGMIPMWQGQTPQGWTVLGLVLLPLIGTAYVVGVSVRTGQGGTRIATTDGAEPERPGTAHTDDDRYWRLAGTLYINRDDPAILVQKRVGIGWTFNLGNPTSIAVAVVAVVGTVAVTLLAAVSG
ncbi:DUF1648 domain-containing protein [Actinopolymorpha pittospori]|uniref:Membrane protein n=1 Tax=Actinopolymorpha pittospori TaxID=648752 RepID=A0A927MXQ7_9ACTN|nr:DUF5808 domain-containing protein [Actinopolymorpha pittospori]MBE1607223.1 putative membrane protein [Actinopolymorpha pittospori]